MVVARKTLEEREMVPKGAQMSDDYTTTTASTMITVAHVFTGSFRVGYHGPAGLLFLRCCVRHDVRRQRSSNFTLLYFLISRTRLLNASSTLIRCLAEVSINLQPKCLARSRPSGM